MKEFIFIVILYIVLAILYNYREIQKNIAFNKKLELEREMKEQEKKEIEKTLKELRIPEFENLLFCLGGIDNIELVYQNTDSGTRWIDESFKEFYTKHLSIEAKRKFFNEYTEKANKEWHKTKCKETIVVVKDPEKTIEKKKTFLIYPEVLEACPQMRISFFTYIKKELLRKDLLKERIYEIFAIGINTDEEL